MRSVELENAHDTLTEYVKSTSDEPIIFLINGKPFATLVRLSDLEEARATDALKRAVLDTLFEAVITHALEDEQAFEAEIIALSNSPEFRALLRERKERRDMANGSHSPEEAREPVSVA